MKEFINIGIITNTHGIKGELKIKPLTDNKERYKYLEYFYIENNNEKIFIEKVWFKKDLVVVKLKDYNNINDVLHFKSKYVSITSDMLVKLPDDSYFIFDLIDITVYTKNGKELGKIKEVLQPGGNDVYVIKDNKREILIPAVKEIIIEVNIPDKKMIIDPIEGMV